MKIDGSVALVTGANRGIGRHFATQLLERGAAKVYATARRPDSVDIEGVEVLQLDVTDEQSVAAAARTAGDVTLLVNNAGSSTGADFINGDLADVRLEMDTHYWGSLLTARAFAPGLAGGAIIDVLSALSWVSFPQTQAYSAAKAAAWALTNGLRLALPDTQVVGLHLGYTDTDMTAGVDAPKNDPADVVRAALDGLEAGLVEVLADDTSRYVKAGLALDPVELYKSVGITI